LLKDGYRGLATLDSTMATSKKIPAKKRDEFANKASEYYNLSILYKDSLDTEEVKK